MKRREEEWVHINDFRAMQSAKDREVAQERKRNMFTAREAFVRGFRDGLNRLTILLDNGYDIRQALMKLDEYAIVRLGEWVAEAAAHAGVMENAPRSSGEPKVPQEVRE